MTSRNGDSSKLNVDLALLIANYYDYRDYRAYIELVKVLQTTQTTTLESAGTTS